ncbi:MAG: hypothetical protein GXY32_06010 [Ruminococcaceae bacterium]|nr:hypothetical protein [Oscillospiraceae bacterium]
MKPKALVIAIITLAALLLAACSPAGTSGAPGSASTGTSASTGASVATSGSAGADASVSATQSLPTGETDEDYDFFVENFEAICADIPAYYDSYDDFYGLLLEMQGRGDIPYQDKLVAEGEVTDTFTLEIDGKAFTNAEAAELTVYTASYVLYTKVEGHDAVWVGYRFTEVCEQLGIEMPQSVKLTADDGFVQTFDAKNIDDNTMIAITRDGSAADGPYFAPCTMLVNANYTKYLVGIEVA